jgi:histone arginine demethylase JMJD6
VNDVSLEEFIEKYEKPYIPCVIQGVTDDWLAVDKWTPSR